MTASPSRTARRTAVPGAKSANKMTARVGDTITYTITLENSARQRADWTGVTVTVLCRRV